MIVFLTLCYCGLLAVLVKTGAIKPTLWWKLSPLVWMLLLLLALFLPMQWGAPAGKVNVYQGVVEVVPNVSGEVIKVDVDGLTPMSEGETLFEIDPTPYQATVDQLKAQLEDTKQNVERLKASAEAAEATVRKSEQDVDLLKAEQVSAAAAVTAAEARLEEEQGKKEKAVAVVSDLKIQLGASERQYARMQTLAAQNAASKTELDRADFNVTGVRNQLKTANIDVKVADDTITRSKADIDAAKAGAASVDLQLKQLVETELLRVRAKAREAEILANSTIGDEHTTVAAVRAQLEKAEFDLEQTTVRAPSDGRVIGLSLQKGQRVAAMPMRTWVSFLPDEHVQLAMGVPQYALRHVKPGQKAEVTLKLYPGKVFSATVERIANTSSQGQLQPSGTVMTAPGVNQAATPYAVRLKLDDPTVKLADLPGGAYGTAAIYTEKMKATHLIRRVMIRMEAWMNYVLPQ